MAVTGTFPSFSCPPARTVELDEVDVVDSLTECNPMSTLALPSPSSFRIWPMLPERFRVTGGLLGLCALFRNPGGGKPGERDETDDGVDMILKSPGEPAKNGEGLFE